MNTELVFLTRRWANGDSALPLVTRLRELGCDAEAAATARIALCESGCIDREQLQAVVEELGSAPDGWMEALAASARTPTEARWDELLAFVPDEVLYQRLRNTIATLMRLGCDGDVLFRCASRSGLNPDIFDLAKSGTVDPAVIEERAAGSPSRAAWLGLAAQAALARGDGFAVIRHLREASRDPAAVLAWASISEIRRDADAALNDDLDRAGVPRI